MAQMINAKQKVSNGIGLMRSKYTFNLKGLIQIRFNPHKRILGVGSETEQEAAQILGYDITYEGERKK